MEVRTAQTYHKSARQLSDHYDAIGAREGDITLALALAGQPENPHILEIGCGNGRDARVIKRYAGKYVGIDISPAMITEARQKMPHTDFIVANALTYEFDGPFDIIFALASFRYFSLAQITHVIKKCHAALRSGGVMYISSNDGPMLEVVKRVDQFGERQIHIYNPAAIIGMAPLGLEPVHSLREMINGQAWFEVAFKKQ